MRLPRPIDSEGLGSVATTAMDCNACFNDGALRRSYVDLPQPRFVGPGYANSSPRIAWVMINPGAGTADPRNTSWLAVLRKFRTREASLDEVFAEQRRHMPYWNRLMGFIELHGLATDDLALINVAWCASEGDNYPEAMLDECWRRHTRGWIELLQPDVVILSGRVVQAFDERVRTILPLVSVYHTFHYAYWSRPPGKIRATARAIELRKELGR